MQWRARGGLGHKVAVLAHSEQDCALVGLCLSVCEVGVRAGGVCELVMCNAFWHLHRDKVTRGRSSLSPHHLAFSVALLAQAHQYQA